MLSQIIDNQNKLLLEKEQEIAELKKECRRCVHTDCPCILSDFGKDRNGICDHFKDVFDENIELKERVKTLTIHDTNAVLNGLEMKVLKDSHRDRANKTQEQLTKAKDLIKQLCLMVRELNNPNVQLTNVDYSLSDAEQFLKESE